MASPSQKSLVARLAAAGVPAAGSDGEEPVRDILARLLATRAVRFADLQLARDLARLHPGPAASAGYPLLVAALSVALDGGSSFLRLAGAADRLAAAVWSPDDSDGDNRGWADAARAAWRDFAEPRLADFAGPPVVATPVPGTLAFQRPWKDVEAVVSRLRALRDADAGAAGAAVAPVAPDLLDRAMRFSFDLDARQRDAVAYAASHRFAVITGGPGTGKTTIVCAVLRALVSSGAVAPGRIALCAPTGRAAQRMGEAVRDQCAKAAGLDAATEAALRGLRGTTVHSLLGGLAPDFLHGAGNPLPHDLVVVDEVSMVGVPLMRALLEALPDGCRLVLIGDPHQLPSVETGAVLGDLVGDAQAPYVARLSDTHRFDGRLKTAAEGINAGSGAPLREPAARLDGADWTAGFGAEPRSGEFFLRTLPAGPVEAARAVRDAVSAWADRFGLCSAKGDLVARASSFRMPEVGEDGVFPMTDEARELFAALDRSRILAVVREGPFGVRGINDRLLDRRRAASRSGAGAAPLALPGVPVIVTRNTKDRHLFNGDVGVVVRAADGTPTAVFPRGEAVVACPAALLPEHDLAYAVTVHKSQGSEYGSVLLVLPAAESCPLLTRQLLYTGVTRARRRAVLLAADAALDAALAREEARDTGVSL